MVDPLQLALAPIATKATTEAIAAVFGQSDSGQASLELDEVVQIVDDLSGATLAVVTHAQMLDIERFLNSSEVAALFQSWAVLHLLGERDEPHEDLLERMEEAFESMVVQWCTTPEVDWSSHSSDIWRLCTNSIQQATVGLQNLALATKKDDEIIERNTTGSQLLRGKRAPAPYFIRRLTDVLSDMARVVRLRAAVQDIRLSCRDDFSELQMNHVQDDYRFEVDQLYVDRTLSLRATGRAYSAGDVLSGLVRRSRVVVIGDPGVGKSTLVRHTMHRIAYQQRVNLAPILIEAREYAGQAWGTRFTEYLTARQATAQSLNIDEDTLVDVLSVGSAYAIFDGVDEITDIQRRREFIRQIESFARSFPLVPVLATSRKVGYSRANFQEDMFHVFELSEFTTAQFEDYVTKWFLLTKRDEAERESFIRESVAVSDVRCNPLMLSLLCTLYRARGHIPRNRRSVYRECAELLFQRWDSMRHVEQPYDHRHYGEKLMQELARFFYKNQSAQAGLEEGQLERVIAAFFQDTASVDPPDNMTRARQFLDFCADRAWLLTVKGSNARGARLFGFTHRTFMEYLAAEALARNAHDLESITDEIVRIYEADPSSVLPDVLVQCVEDKSDRGAETVLKSLLQRGKRASSYGDKYLSLCLRIVNSCPMSRAISVPLPGEIQSYWKKTGDIERTIESSRALFELYRDPRNRIVRSLVEDAAQYQQLVNLGFDREEFVQSVCGRWARFHMLDEEHHFESGWNAGLEEHYVEMARSLSSGASIRFKRDYIITDYLVETGRISVSEIADHGKNSPHLYIVPFGSLRPGSIVRSLFRILVDGNVREHDDELLLWFGGQLPFEMSQSEANCLTEVMSKASQQVNTIDHAELVRATEEKSHILNILLWIGVVTYEAKAPSMNPFHVTFDGVIGSSLFEDLVVSREARLDTESHESRPMSQKAVTAICREIGAPTWFSSWVNGRRSFVTADVHESDEEDD